MIIFYFVYTKHHVLLICNENKEKICCQFDDTIEVYFLLGINILGVFILNGLKNGEGRLNMAITGVCFGRYWFWQVNLSPNSSLGWSLNSIIKIAGTLCTLVLWKQMHVDASSYDNVQKFNVYSMQLRLKTHRLKKKKRKLSRQDAIR